VPARRLVFALVIAGGMVVVAAPACSSSNKNSEGGGGGGAEDAAPSCVDAGDCNACCEAAVGSGPMNAYKLSARTCVCEGSPPVCPVPCGSLCTDDIITGGCILCLHTLGASCMVNTCVQGDCQAFQECVKTCE
jgi:hypothetical protein